MELESAQKVFGFSCGLDWRPTVFVNGIPSNRVCSACRLVPSNIAVLPCRHVLCQPCYDRCLSNGSRCCLDGEDILPNDVLWSAISADSILDRKIRCWNFPWGCGFTGPASEVLQHFNIECQYHTVTCLRCRGSIAHKDIVNHLESGVCGQTSGTKSVTERIESGAMCITNALSNLDTKVSLLQQSFEENLKFITSGSAKMLVKKTAPESPILESMQCLENTLTESAQLCRCAVDQMADAQAALQNNIGAVMSSLREVKDEVSELKASLNQTFVEKTNENLAVCSDIKHSIDMLETAAAAEHKKIGEKLEALERMMQEQTSEPASSECSEQCRDDVTEKTHVPESVSSLPLERRLNISEAVEWAIESWSEARGECNRQGSSFKHPPNPRYFYGYRISPFAVLRGGKSQSVHVGFRIYAGECDKLLAWPMRKVVHLTLLHPTTCGQAESIVACTACESPECFMPVGLQNLPRWSTANIDAERLEALGYVKDDKLLLRFEVLECTEPNNHPGPQFL